MTATTAEQIIGKFREAELPELERAAELAEQPVVVFGAGHHSP